MTTKTPRLSATDFMMMDVHEPLSPEEINEINPQAAVDKTLGAEQDEVGADEGVDSSPARCEFCFGPRPCPDHPNVEPLSVVTSLACPPMTMLAQANSADLETVVIVGVGKDGTEYFASSSPDAAESIYYLQRGIHKLNRTVDGDDHH